MKDGKVRKMRQKPIQVIRDNVMIMMNNNLKYDLLNGIGKTGFKKVDFQENLVLSGMAAYKRLDESIKLHTNWNPMYQSSAGIIRKWGISILMFLCGYFVL